MDQRQAVFLKESESPDKNMNALTRRTHLHLLLLPLAVAASLAACGGGDDDGGQVDPPVAPTNLADCFNPSMYTAGSSWSVASTTTFLSSAPGATQRAQSEVDRLERTREELMSDTDAVRAALRNRTVLHARVFDMDAGTAGAY